MKYCPNPECPFFADIGEPGEYVDTATRCSDCGAELVTRRPDFSELPTLQWDDMTPVMSIPDAALVPVIESLLAGEGIAHYVHGENLQDLFGVGRVGSGFNVITGLPVLYVDSARVEEAERLLEDLQEAAREEAEEGA
jgi:hypothetical protein